MLEEVALGAGGSSTRCWRKWHKVLSGWQLSSMGPEAGVERLGLKGGNFVGIGEALLDCFRLLSVNFESHGLLGICNCLYT